MRRHVPLLLVLIVCACFVEAPRADTRTEVALYGLVSWKAQRNPDMPTEWQSLVGLMPNATSTPPQCLENESPPDFHFPVLKIVTGSPDWEGRKSLPPFEGQAQVFALAGHDVTLEDNEFFDLRPVGLELLSNDTVLNSIKSRTIVDQNQVVSLDPALLATLQPTESRLGARVTFQQGIAIAAQSLHCPDEPSTYLAEKNTNTPAGEERGCPVGEPIGHRLLAEEMTVRLHGNGVRLTVRFHPWADGASTKNDRILYVDPVDSGGVRIELSNQIKSSAKVKDSRDATLCLQGHPHAYLWYYDLRDGSCPRPAYFPCYASFLGGTKCPEHHWVP